MRLLSSLRLDAGIMDPFRGGALRSVAAVRKFRAGDAILNRCSRFLSAYNANGSE
jgi:hypothetical protein